MIGLYDSYSLQFNRYMESEILSTTFTSSLICLVTEDLLGINMKLFLYAASQSNSFVFVLF